MASMICVQCSNADETVEFPSVKDYVDHEKGGHVSRPVKILPPSVEKGPSATESPVAAATSPATNQPQKQEDSVKDPEIPPLSLEYKWVGICKVCKSEVKTITVDLGKKAIIIAYCFTCSAKLGQRQVVPLSQQELEAGIETVFERNIKPRKP